MIVLGLYFGHDASVCVIKNGKVVAFREKERYVRLKHAIALDANDINACLNDANLKLTDIDYCGLTSTQSVEYILPELNNLNITLGKTDRHKLPCTMTDELNVNTKHMYKMASGLMQDTMKVPHKYSNFFSADFQEKTLKDDNFFGGFEHFIDTGLWSRVNKLGDISNTSYKPFINNTIRFGFHYPATLTMGNTSIPSYCFSHHFAHASYSFYQSPYKESAILTHDGGGHGGSYLCGFFAYGIENKIYSLTPHHLSAGELYDYSAVRLGFDLAGGAGKLMGLSAYGEPTFFDDRFVGNYYDQGMIGPKKWIEHCNRIAKHDPRYKYEDFGNTEKILSKVNVDFASSTQKIFEETMLKAVRTVKSITSNLSKNNNSLCLGGGAALNCPSNSIIKNSNEFKNISILPATIDSGLSIGSALAIYYNLANNKRTIDKKNDSPIIGYLGSHKSDGEENIVAAIKKYEHGIKVKNISTASKLMAKAISDNKVIGIFYGKSEVGPRALGHRSIIANATYKDNWARVNLIKKREQWRPFAPAVLEGDESRYFDELANKSYFMLVNANVTAKSIPAVTHVDNSARVQVVTKDCGLFFDFLVEYKKLSSHSVVLNTSFNGPGSPIVETPEEALDFLMNSQLDAVFFKNYMIERA